MVHPFLAEIRIFAGTYAPRGWALCDGRLLPISQNTALFQLLGTAYGGDGRTTFALPDLRGRAPVLASREPGYELGTAGGAPSTTLTQAEMPSHSHTVNVAAADPGNFTQPASDRVLARSGQGDAYQTDAASGLAALSPAAIGEAGEGRPHNNMQPHLALKFIIALQGVFPVRD